VSLVLVTDFLSSHNQECCRENVSEFGKSVMNEHEFHDEIKGRINSGNACYYSL
jgi:hypothetical protein